MTVFDLKSSAFIGHNTSISEWKGMVNAQWTNDLFTTHKLSAETRIQQVCAKVPRQLPSPKVFLLRSTSLHGLRSADLPRKSSRDRNMLARLAAQTLPCWDSGKVPRSTPPETNETKTGEIMRTFLRCYPKSKTP